MTSDDNSPRITRRRTWLIIDGANVVGSRPDGWWRDPAGAAARLAGQLDRAQRAGVLSSLATGPEELPGRTSAAGPIQPEALAGTGSAERGVRLILVLEGQAKRAELPPDPALEVRLAPKDGDSAILELAHRLTGEGDEVQVVTADRELGRLLTAVGARTVRPSRLLRLLAPARA